VLDWFYPKSLYWENRTTRIIIVLICLLARVTRKHGLNMALRNGHPNYKFLLMCILECPMKCIIKNII